MASKKILAVCIWISKPSEVFRPSPLYIEYKIVSAASYDSYPQLFWLHDIPVMILLSYHHMDYFFISTQLCVLPPSLFLVIAHSAIHAFLVLWVVTCVTHSIFVRVFLLTLILIFPLILVLVLTHNLVIVDSSALA